MKELFCIGGVAAMAQLVLCFDPFCQSDTYEAAVQYTMNQEDSEPHCFELDLYGYIKSETAILWECRHQGQKHSGTNTIRSSI